MINQSYLKKVFIMILAMISTYDVASAQAQKNDKPIKNIVLVHGAFVDGSGWEGVYRILTEKGYSVTVTQHSLRDFDEDLLSVEKAISQQDGPCILVGHSYGGVIISAAGNHPKVAGLVYITAHAPDSSERRADLLKTYPPANKFTIKGADGFDHIEPAKFAEEFAGGVPLEKASFMANSQVPTADKVFAAVIQRPAWKFKPSWYLVGSADRIINPDLERFYAKRAKSIKVIEINGGSHSSYVSHPKETAQLIIDAANYSY